MKMGRRDEKVKNEMKVGVGRKIVKAYAAVSLLYIHAGI